MIEIEGWLTPQEGQCLQELVSLAPGNIIVEIGAWKGRSTAYFSGGLPGKR
jgi:predicted O-methyltransferase YrrM